MVGEVVTYNGVTYTCIQNILSSGYGPVGDNIGSYWMVGTTIPTVAPNQVITITAFAFSPSNETDWTDQNGTRSIYSYLASSAPNYRGSYNNVVAIDMDTIVFPPYLTESQKVIAINTVKTGINTKLVAISGPVTLFTTTAKSLAPVSKGLGFFSTSTDVSNPGAYTANMVSVVTTGPQTFTNTYSMYTVQLTFVLYPTITGPNPVVSASVAKAQTIRYKKVVCWGLSPQTINFASAGTLGHRVCISIPVDVMNQIFVWSRTTGEVSPTGRLNNVHSANSSPLADALVTAMSNGFSDIDGVSSALNFSSTALDMAGDLKRDPSVYNAATRVSQGISSTHYGANDLVMAYLMFKCFGSSSYDPTDVIYNLDDAFSMLSSEQLAAAITDSLEAEDALANSCVLPNGKAVSAQLPGDNKGQVDAMFRAFLAADPLRYFLNGVQIPGLFETNFVAPATVAGADPSVGGNWCLTVGDKLEIPLQLVFRAPVNVLSVQDNIQNPSSNTPDSTNTNFIKGETNFNNSKVADKANAIPIRLQILCSAPSAGGSSTGGTSQVTLPLQIAAAVPVVFYTPGDYGIQTALATMAAGGTGPYNYAFGQVLPAIPSVQQGFSINSANGLLTFKAPVATTSVAYDAAVAADAAASAAAEAAPSDTAKAGAAWAAAAAKRSALAAMTAAGGASGVRSVVSGKYAVPIVITDSANPMATITATVNITFDDGTGSSNNANLPPV